MTPNEQLKIDHFQEALAIFLCANEDGAATLQHRVEVATARGEVQKIIGAEREYIAAVTAAHQELTACRVARWQRPRLDHDGLVVHR